ncbi:hypothetical protein niasHT_002069 [Heterodera trifolii]|uniref:Uncharacterized protein n=1 Tax=Heterodera trifolii TaxID=157864 RepID=A0ABD2M6J9_9BILA
MSDNRKEAEEKMAKAIFISGDGWLAVFDLLEPSQLGVGIALISHRFDFYVDVHFKTRKWALNSMQILHKIGGNGTKKMKIINCHLKPLPIPQNQLPRKVMGFGRFIITFFNNAVIAFLYRFRRCQRRRPTDKRPTRKIPTLKRPTDKRSTPTEDPRTKDP